MCSSTSSRPPCVTTSSPMSRLLRRLSINNTIRLTHHMSTNAQSAFPIPPLATRFPSSTAIRGDTVLFPGVSDESTQSVRRLLEENDRRFHIYRKISCVVSCDSSSTRRLNSSQESSRLMK